MQPQKQQLEPVSERKEPKNRDKPDSSSGSRNEHQHSTDKMNFSDTAHANAAPHEQYEGMSKWSLSPGATSLSPATANFFSGYTFPGIGTSGGGEIPTMNAEFCSQEEGRPTSLTREDQANNISYTMLASNRNACSTASVDGTIQEPHLNDM